MGLHPSSLSPSAGPPFVASCLSDGRLQETVPLRHASSSLIFRHQSTRWTSTWISEGGAARSCPPCSQSFGLRRACDAEDEIGAMAGVGIPGDERRRETRLSLSSKRCRPPSLDVCSFFPPRADLPLSSLLPPRSISSSPRWKTSLSGAASRPLASTLSSRT